MKKKLGAVLLVGALALALALPAAPVAAHPDHWGLYAGGGNWDKVIEVGRVFVWNDADNLYVRYETNSGWEMTETHLAVAADLGDIPQTRKGNPKPGKFPYKTDHDPAVTEYTYPPIPLNGWVPGTDLCIVAHAVIQLVDDGNIIQEETAWGDCNYFNGNRYNVEPPFARGNWAKYIKYQVQGILTGTWLLDVNDGTYMHDMFIVSQSASGALSGTGGYPASGPPYNPGYDWTLTGQLTGNSVTLVITYTNTYTTTLTGTVDPSWNSMSGTGTAGVVTWVATRLL